MFCYKGDWKDVGTWNTMSEVMADKGIGNVIIDEKCENTNIINELNIPLFVMGFKDLIIVASNDGILVSDKECSGYMKLYVEKLGDRLHYANKSWVGDL